MKLRCDMTVNGVMYAKGTDVPWYAIYPFFMIHMLAFGAATYALAYGSKKTDLGAVYGCGGFAVLIYIVFYLVIFGVDEIKWMFINAILGVLGIYTEMGWLLSLFGKKVDNYPFNVNLVPYIFFVMYTFLLRHALLDLTDSREEPTRKKWVENIYIGISVAISGLTYFLGRR